MVVTPNSSKDTYIDFEIDYDHDLSKIGLHTPRHMYTFLRT